MGHYARRHPRPFGAAPNSSEASGVLLKAMPIDPTPHSHRQQGGRGVFAGDIRKLSSVARNDDKACRMFQWEQAIRQADDVDTMMAAQTGRFR